MYGPPNPKLLDLFGGKRLELVSVTANQVLLQFNGDLGLQVESTCSVTPIRGDDPGWFPAGKSADCGALVALIGANVVRAEIGNGGALVIMFEKGRTFRCTEHPSFESYQISHGSETTVI